ncbi:uncharacterized protein Z519_06597 [Cladophialophora bantiana CBS 173.52]|uniref:Major facilitator superfamily (MFS) profile domain-containing protein n=1 Tax=Cladophialophora bantiana (strain ATCC 10958 / CBS 173.52 / CDC B-1940 / NIH 8579) TaxID=1442370 RepID=A0A0D2I7C9_CLAB1|nr:uncharacterized protein Z519_06597 [Cladophialophora bantiana CBS 173.52]KIW92749.1 hypothetical protein Z519_06597 [Cladophialophora bantiana CBS 173.52]
MFTNQIGMGNTLTTVGVIGESFGLNNQGQLSWLIAGYSLTTGTFILISGRLGDDLVFPVIPSGLTSALAVGKLLGKIPASWIMVIGQVAYLVGSILAAARPVDSIYWTYCFFSVLIITIGMDTSFASATIIFSNAVPQRYQGMGARIDMTVVNYSISLGLGFAGTVETNINHGGLTRSDMLLGYRGALWFAVGLAGLSLVLVSCSLSTGRADLKPEPQNF